MTTGAPTLRAIGGARLAAGFSLCVALFCVALFCVVACLPFATAAYAEEPGAWDTGVKLRGGLPAVTNDSKPAEQPKELNLPANTTVVPRKAPDAPVTGEPNAHINLLALLTADGQQIDQGIVWRLYSDDGSIPKGQTKLLMTLSEPSPTVQLKPGDYIVNAAFGRADVTRKIKVTAGETMSEKFVLNAGGLRVKVTVDGTAPSPNAAAFDIYSGERDQSDNRTKVVGAAKPGVVVRLNAGIYRIVSTYGDANATVEADVTVEAGKLTEATVAHSAARVTFKLVARLGGEALPDTQWTVQTREGQVVKRSVGALPTHILAPGTYTIFGKSGNKTYKRDFTIAAGENTQVEVLMQ
jgi:hypothetical protein